MKTSFIVEVLLLMGIAVLIWGNYASDLDNVYADNQINANWSSKYDIAENINASSAGLKSNLETLADDDKSWFSKIGAGIVAIPRAVMLLPILGFESLASFSNFTSDLLAYYNIPPEVTRGILVLLGVFIIFGLLEWFQRSKP